MLRLNVKRDCQKKIYIINPDVDINPEFDNSNCFKKEMLDCLRQLKFIKQSESHDFRIIKMTIFVNCNDSNEFKKVYVELKRLIESDFEILDFPVLFVVQPPAIHKNVAIEVMALTEPLSGYLLDYENNENYSLCKVINGDSFELFGNIITSAYSNQNVFFTDNESIYSQSNFCFEVLKKILKNNNLDFQNLIRQWGYIGGITNCELVNSKDKNSKMENYQMFNMARAEYYKDVEWKFGYPAATGIGTYSDKCSIEFVAVSENIGKYIIPLHNPIQSDAHRYEGKQFIIKNNSIQNEKLNTPKFERGKIVISGNTLELYVSGTAAILGEESISGNITEQTKTTLDNIVRLCSKENLFAHGLQLEGDLPEFSGVRAYIKYPKDACLVEEMCRKVFGEIPILFVIADVCREELLVEIECFLSCSIENLITDD